MAVRIGVDAGGTFTDVCLVAEDGAIALFKLASSPADPSLAITDGVIAILDQQERARSSVAYLGHGTTVATNTLLEQRGVPTGVITTKGFRDLLELGRQRRPDLYDLQVDKPTPLVRRALRMEVPERVTASGDVLLPLDLEAVRAAVRRLRDAGVSALAVCLLYSYLQPEHERQIGEVIHEEFPDAYTSLSHEVLAEFREYERLSTTVVNSYVGPIMSRYIRNLRDRLRDASLTAEPYINQSNGGIVSLESAADFPVRTILSGPAAGVVGAIAVAARAGFPDVITFDMGGTSTDAALITDGACSVKLEQDVAGYPIRTPLLDINTVGAGGGSIAWIDSGGHLKVGPRSAGAAPGPACYDQGGTAATVTDANVALGILSREAFLGGRMPIASAAADRAIATLASELGQECETVAQGIIDIATMNMARAIRVISVERGYDPRDYALFAFGGAGPLHAGRLARELEIPRILVPPMPGILCAYGLLVSDLRADFSRTLVLPAESGSLAALDAGLAELQEMATAWAKRERIEADQIQIRRLADMRYAGQNYELSIALPDHAPAERDLPTIRNAFHAAHEQAYGYAAADEPAQFVTIRLEAAGHVPKPSLQPAPVGAGLDQARAGTRRIYLPDAGGWRDVPLYARGRLQAGSTLPGPAVVEQMDSTTLVLSGQTLQVDTIGTLIIEEERIR